MSITKEQAEALFSEIRDGLINVEQKLIEVVQTKAWEPLGYETFEEAWRDRMQGVRLATSGMKAAVVYAALNDGMKPDEIVRRLNVPIRKAEIEAIVETKAKGLPPEAHTTYVRAYIRTKGTQPAHTLHVDIGAGDYAYYKNLASRYGFDLATEAAAGLRERVGGWLRGEIKQGNESVG